MQLRHLVFLIIVCLTALGCPTEQELSKFLSEQPPTISSFSANPETIEKGQETTLDWFTISATEVSLDQGIGSVPIRGTKTVKPIADTAYTLSASNKNGTVTRTITVFVKPST